jgi:6-phosphogluconolactonase/glucosamine-6-phosphate isomerase/deaminase
VLFVDERNVPLGSTDSNYRAAHEELLRKVPVPASQILAIKEGLPVAHAATHYAGACAAPVHSLLSASHHPKFRCSSLAMYPHSSRSWLRSG